MRLLAVSCALLPLVSGALLLLSKPAGRKGARLLAATGLGVSALFAGILFRQGGTGIYGSFDSDPLSSFLVEILLVALALPLVRHSGEAVVGRLLLGGTLAIVAVSTRDLLWATLALVLFPFVVGQKRSKGEGVAGAGWIFAITCLVGLALVAFQCGSTDLAVIAASGRAATSAGRAGLALVAAGVVLLWLASSRDSFRFSDEDLVTRVSSSFLLLVAAASVLLRLTAWLPDAAPLVVIRALALAALGLGALGMLGATRIRTFVTALALARAGIVLAALLGGVHGRMPFLLELGTTAASLFLLAWGIDAAAQTAVSLDELRAGSSPATRLCLLVGALSASSFPPFPGFAIQFPLARALASAGETPALVAAAVLVFLVGLGSMRVVSRAFAGGAQPSPSSGSRQALVGLALAAVATWFLGVYPARLIDLATRAIAEMF